MIRNMSDKSRTENNRNEDSKAEKLFRAMSGADEELLLRSEQNGSSNTGKLHKFPMRYVARIAAACLCFAVAGVMYMTMSSTKMADSTGSAEMAAAQVEQYAAEWAEDAVTESASELPEATMAENTSGLPEGALEGAMSEAADSGAPEKQDSQMSAVAADSCCDGGMVESSTEASDEMQEEEVMEKQGRHLPGKMTRKGQ